MAADRQGDSRHDFAEQLGRPADELCESARGLVDAETTPRFVYETFDLVSADAKVTTHLMTLTRRLARERLNDHARGSGVRITAPQVLFGCVHLIGLSQMAAALLDDVRRAAMTREFAERLLMTRRDGAAATTRTTESATSLRYARFSFTAIRTSP